MKKSIDTEALKLIYGQYQGYLLPVGIIIASLLLFFYVIIPQITSFTDLQKQMEKESQKLTVLRSNINYLSNLDSNSLDANFKTATNTLPKEKDFVGVLSAVNEASGRSSVSLGDYQFKVGDLGVAKATLKGLPFLEIDLNIVGNSSDLIRFIKELQKTIPISDVVNGGTSGPSAFLTVRFYYLSLPSVSLASDTAIRPIATNEEAILKNLATWNNQQYAIPLIPQTTGAATFTPRSSSPFE